MGLKSLLIVIGGAVGTGLRAWLETTWPSQPGGWPWATFVINITGAFLLGLLLETMTRRGPDTGVRQLLRLGLGTGLLGGYTTYSTFSVETVALLRIGAVPVGIGYALASVLLGLLAALAGAALAGRQPRGRAT